jgi:hypothetical protein
MEQRPFILNVEDAKNEMIDAVNNISKKYNVPYYFLLPTLADMLAQARNAAKNELEVAKKYDAEKSV